MRLAVASFLVLGTTACATETAPPPAPPEPVYLSSSEFTQLWNAAYKSDPESEAEVAFTEMLARDDLSPSQIGEVYYGRGTLRGIYTRDWPEAYPQCALGDFLKAKDYPITEARLQQMKQSMKYQIDRRQYFPNAPEDCKANVVEAYEWLQSVGG